MSKESKFKMKEDLKSKAKEDFNGDYEAMIIEQWKTCVETANGITEKRNNANSIFITINTALFAVVTFSLDYKSVLLSAIGIFVCILWLKLLENYKMLNKTKYYIINEIEEMLPLSPFKAEWYRLKDEEKYTGLTKVEKIIPIVFIVLYSVALLWPLLKVALKLICPCISD